ncbi:MAG: FmdB family zinc ribbon protein [Dehalococcoidia bacterium]
MPIYEYWCEACRRVVSSYRPGFSSPLLSCPACDGTGLRRVFSTFSVQRTYRDTYEEILSDRQLTQGMMRNDPRALAEWSKKMSSGEKCAPEYEELSERMERGEWPADQIEEKRRQILE